MAPIIALSGDSISWQRSLPTLHWLQELSKTIRITTLCACSSVVIEESIVAIVNKSNDDTTFGSRVEENLKQYLSSLLPDEGKFVEYDDVASTRQLNAFVMKAHLEICNRALELKRDKFLRRVYLRGSRVITTSTPKLAMVIHRYVPKELIANTHVQLRQILDVRSLTTEKAIREFYQLYYLHHCQILDGIVCLKLDSMRRVLHRNVLERWDASRLDQMTCFMMAFVPASFVGNRSLMEFGAAASTDLATRNFLLHYVEHVAWSGTSYSVRKGSERELLPREDAIRLVKSSTESIMNMYEYLLGNSSEGVGGTYQTTQSGSLIALFAVVTRILMWMFGSHTRFVVMDVGCGGNRPMWLVSNIFGHATIGVEVCSERALVAAKAAMHMMEHKYGRNSRIALFYEDGTESANWTGIHCFYVWDVAFGPKTTTKIIRNIARALDGGAEALLVISSRHRKRVDDLLDEYFIHQVVGDPIDLRFKAFSSTSRVRMFRLRKRDEVSSLLSPVPNGPGVLERSWEDCSSPVSRTRHYKSLIDKLTHRAKREKSERKHNKRKKELMPANVTKKRRKRTKEKTRLSHTTTEGRNSIRITSRDGIVIDLFQSGI